MLLIPTTAGHILGREITGDQYSGNLHPWPWGWEPALMGKSPIQVHRCDGIPQVHVLRWHVVVHAFRQLCSVTSMCIDFKKNGETSSVYNKRWVKLAVEGGAFSWSPTLLVHGTWAHGPQWAFLAKLYSTLYVPFVCPWEWQYMRQVCRRLRH